MLCSWCMEYGMDFFVIKIDCVAVLDLTFLP
jgi:hypothetical protein